MDSKSTLPDIFSNLPFKGVLLNNSLGIANSSMLSEPLIFDSF